MHIWYIAPKHISSLRSSARVRGCILFVLTLAEAMVLVLRRYDKVTLFFLNNILYAQYQVKEFAAHRDNGVEHPDRIIYNAIYKTLRKLFKKDEL